MGRGRVERETFKKEIPVGDTSPQCIKEVEGQNRKLKDTGKDNCWCSRWDQLQISEHQKEE